MEPFLAILRKHRPDLFPAGATGWGGCRCGCHGPRPVVMHIRACCHPGREEFDAIVELLRENDDAADEIRELLAEVRRGAMSEPFGALLLGLALGGR